VSEHSPAPSSACEHVSRKPQKRVQAAATFPVCSFSTTSRASYTLKPLVIVFSVLLVLDKFGHGRFNHAADALRLTGTETGTGRKLRF